MADITLSYKGATISEISASGTKTLKTGGKYCEGDIGIEYVKPSGSSYVKLAEAEYTVNATNTSSSIIGTISIDPTVAFTSAKMIMVTVRDKAGKRQGYFLGCDAIFANPNPANGTTTSMSNPARTTYLYNSSGQFVVNNSGYGVFAYNLANTGNIRIGSRYSATSSLTIDGTYKVEVWALAFPDGSPYDL